MGEIDVDPVGAEGVDIVILVHRQDHPLDFAGAEDQPGDGDFRAGALRHHPAVCIADFEEDEPLQPRIAAEHQRPAGVVPQGNAGVNRFVLHVNRAVEVDVQPHLRVDGEGGQQKEEAGDEFAGGEFYHDFRDPFLVSRRVEISSAMRSGSSA